jgi:hypothetical protein
MSQENVETVGRLIAAINARDIDGYLAAGPSWRSAAWRPLVRGFS